MANTITDRTKDMKVTTAATYLIARRESPGKKAIIIAPIAGRKTIHVK
jgi:hypothetical protein